MNYGDRKRPYNRVTLSVRNALLRKILVDKDTIKDACEALGVKYPTAKNVLKQYRLSSEPPLIRTEDLPRL